MQRSAIAKLFILIGSFSLILSFQPAFSRAKNNISALENPIFLPAILLNATFTPIDGASGLLVNDGIVETPAGVGVGALSSSLTEPVTVTIQTAAFPGVELPPLAQAASSFYQFSAEEMVVPPFDQPLIIAFPVPNGADPNSLALGVLQSSTEALDVEAAGFAWSILEGKYDPDEDLFLTTLNRLDVVGRVLVLLEGPNFDSPANSSLPLNEIQLEAPNSVPFAATCTNFTNPADCTSLTEQTVQVNLENIYQRIVDDLGYPPPRLRRRIDTINYFPNGFTYFGYSAYIEPHNQGFCNGAAGYYTPEESRLVICFNPAIGFSEYVLDVMVHEYFHATQFAFPQVFTERLANSNENWIIEGMAKAAEKSYLTPEMHRGTAGNWEQLHKVDVPINDETESNETPYFAQDFWVFVGRFLTQDFSYLKDILNSGSTTWDASNILGDTYRIGVYWDWAKNQAIEAQDNLDGALTTPCTLESGVVKQVEMFDYDFFQKIFHIVTVEPLNSMVVKINFDHNYDMAYVGGWLENPNLPGAIESFEFKVYVDGESGCESIPDKNRLLENVTTSGNYYVVISNIDIDDSYNYILYIEAAPIPSQ